MSRGTTYFRARTLNGLRRAPLPHAGHRGPLAIADDADVWHTATALTERFSKRRKTPALKRTDLFVIHLRSKCGKELIASFTRPLPRRWRRRVARRAVDCLACLAAS